MTIEQQVGEALADKARRTTVDVDALWTRASERASSPAAPQGSWLPVLAAAAVVVTVIAGAATLWAPDGGEARAPSAAPAPTTEPHRPGAEVLSTRGYASRGPVGVLRNELRRGFFSLAVEDSEILLLDVRTPGGALGSGRVFSYGHACQTVEGPVLCISRVPMGPGRPNIHIRFFDDPFGRRANRFPWPGPLSLVATGGPPDSTAQVATRSGAILATSVRGGGWDRQMLLALVPDGEEATITVTAPDGSTEVLPLPLRE